MSDVLEKIKIELGDGKVGIEISEDELVEAMSMLDDLAEFVKNRNGNTQSIHSAIKGLAQLWMIMFGEGEVEK